jgi:hypothetical protein
VCEGDSANLFAYVDGDPVNWVDPLGLDPEDPRRLREAADAAAGFVPGVSTGVDALVAATGYNPITGQCVGAFDRGLALAGFIIPGISGGRLRAVKNLFTRGRSFFKGARYGPKVLDQVSHVDDIRHAFPSSVDGYADAFGKRTRFRGDDGRL